LATGSSGSRVRIRPSATLRQWRAGFASHLRALGVAANATPRYVRGEITPQKPDGIYRARARVGSTDWEKRVNAVAQELVQGKLQVESGKAKLVRTRQAVRRAWPTLSETLIQQGHPEVAAQAKRYVEQMPKPLTVKEYIATKLLELAREPKTREIEMAR
jgi:hypothetical protein